MGNINLLSVFLGAVAFFAVGVVWYGALFGRAWRRLTGVADDIVLDSSPMSSSNPTWVIMALCFAFELLISLTLAHQYSMTAPVSDRAKMMIALGYGATLMTPALGINYLFQMRPGRLFFIDAGYLIFGMMAMGGVYCLMD
jgi:hypothetical protein